MSKDALCGLVPFSLKRHCPKCGGGTRMAHHADGEYRSGHACSASNALGTGYPPEHICVSCERCHYTWPMRTKDASRSERAS